jgi:hypothetical protein
MYLGRSEAKGDSAMTGHSNVILEKDGVSRYQERHGVNRVYPMNGVPETREPQYTDEEKKILSKPVIATARRDNERAKKNNSASI